MTFRIRAARDEDLQPLYEMAKLTGGGFTNLPPEKDALRAKLVRSHAAFARDEDGLFDDLFVLVLENVDTGEVRGTCQIFTHVGQHWPFYSYRLGTVTKHSQELDRTFRAEILSLVNDLEGAAKSAACSFIRASAPAGSACCSRAAAICSSRATARASPTASWPNCAG
jgi:arginine N-succinyltransferase